MSDTYAAPGGGDEPVSVPFTPSTPAENHSTTVSEAARQLANWRVKRNETPETPEKAEPAKAAPPPKLAETPTSDAPPQEAPVAETDPQADPDEFPPIEPPRSWTQAEKEEFATYPYEAQEKIARREQDREAALRRSQNEAAELRKGTETERLRAEQARKQYEEAIPAVLRALQDQQQGAFSDIKTIDDVQRLAREDYPRYAMWDAQQKQIAAFTQEAKAAQERQQVEFKNQWTEYASKQDQLLVDRAPELSDKARQAKVADKAVSTLKDMGFTEQELAQAWNGEASVSLRDHRLQLLILDAVKFREAKAAVAKPAPKLVPPVQRPGVGKSAVTQDDADLQALEKKFASSGSLKDAAALRLARMRASA